MTNDTDIELPAGAASVELWSGCYAFVHRGDLVGIQKSEVGDRAYRHRTVLASRATTASE